MLQTVIIADDLTGANDTGAILAQNGFHVGTVLNSAHMNDFKDFDTLCISTDSRAMTQEEAYNAIQKAAQIFPKNDSILYSKRIDSTLRGNVGAEIDSILDYLGESYTAIVVASFPGSGRTCVGDMLLVNQVPLQLTEVSKDPINPMTTSRVTEIVKKQSKHKVGYIGLEKVSDYSVTLLKELETVMESCRVIVIDARTQQDIETIAACCAASNKNIVAIDPGAFTAALAEFRFHKKKYETGKSILCAVGSVSELTLKQVAYLQQNDNPGIVKINPELFFEEETRETEIARVAKEICEKEKQFQILLITTTDSDRKLVDFNSINGAQGLTTRQCSRVITETLADTVIRILDELGDKIGGLYASGGDVSVAISEKLGISGFDVCDEVIPLAIYSRIIGSRHDGLPIVTKGGLIGKENTLQVCINYLKAVTD